jgi:chromosome partitioning protein
MHVIILANSKGGTSKSTLTAHLAVEAERQGAGAVAIIDTDPQGSLASWWNTREGETPVFAVVDIARLSEHLASLRDQGVAIVFIDTPPTLTPATHRTLEVADLVLIPVRPSPHDLRAVGTILEAVESKEKSFVFVIVQAIPRSTIALEAVQALAQHGKVAPVIMHSRLDFVSSMIDGRTAQELQPASRSASEITQLWQYVNTQISKRGRK